MGVDLLRQDKRWKEGLMDIRHIMADLVQKVCISQFCLTIFFIYIHAAAGGTSSKSNFSLAILEILESVTMEMALTLTM